RKEQSLAAQTLPWPVWPQLLLRALPLLAHASLTSLYWVKLRERLRPVPAYRTYANVSSECSQCILTGVLPSHDQQTMGSGMSPPLEPAVHRIGEHLARLSAGRTPTLFERRWWSQSALNMAMHDSVFKTQLFRFIDVLPSITDDEEVVA